MTDSLFPFGFSGHIYDIDQTVEDGVSIKIINTRTGETTSTITNSAGEFVLDLANFTAGDGTKSGWNNNDIVFVQAWKLGTPNKFVTTSFLVEGESKELDLYLRSEFNKRAISNKSWNDLNLETFGFEFGTQKMMGVDAERVDMAYDSSGNVTSIAEYINGSKITTTLTWVSGNCVKIEVS